LPPRFVAEDDKIMLFQPIQPIFLIISSVVFTGSLLVALKRAGLLVRNASNKHQVLHNFFGGGNN